MTFTGFTESDFEVFSIDGLENRMDALITHIRPKLDALGEHFAPTLSVMTGEEMFAHVAKHARRKVNPPNDTWVAFANNSRGYKMLPHFQIGLWGSHVFIWFAVIYEAPQKADYGKKLQSMINQIHDDIPKNFVWSIDHMKPDVLKHAELTKEELTDMFVRLQTIKKAEILCGYQIPKEEAVLMSGQQMVDKIQLVFSQILPLYKLIR
ncbi:YktB family protein [Niallia oryzisoli]|uniref:YktB family protein n=1 Tax=Niallia oryzisoli TaxID=1737571 RepID=UPI0037350550